MQKWIPLLVAFSIGCHRTSPDLPEIETVSEPSEKVRNRLGEKTLSILREADRVEVFRLDPSERAKGEFKFHDYVVTSIGKVQGQTFARNLSEILMKDGTYFGTSFHCFEPGVGFRIWNGGDSVEIAICFGCSNFHVGEAFGAFGGSKGVYGQLARLAKIAFPDDEAIQQIPNKSRFEVE